MSKSGKEMKFKLKKAGKYFAKAKFSGGVLLYNFYCWKDDRCIGFKPEDYISESLLPEQDKRFLYGFSSIGISTHPFVCFDRDGKEVYAGDRVKCLDDNVDLQEAIIGEWNLSWSLIDPTEINSSDKKYYPLTGYMEARGDCCDIQLIESEE